MKFHEGIAAQPGVLSRSARGLVDAIDHVPVPKKGQVIGLVGIGASDHAARGAAHTWRAAGLRAFALSASEILTRTDTSADLYLAISESGRSTETVEAVHALGNATTIALTNDPGSPLADAVGITLPLDSGDDSPVYTTGYTATLQALGMLGERWSGGIADWSALPEQAQQVLDGCAAAVAMVAESFDRVRLVDVIASGAGCSTVGEGALMLRESARLHTADHETRNYLHGPMEPLDEQTGCIVIGEGREIRLARDTAALGAPTVLVTTQAGIADVANLTVIQVPRARSSLGQAVLDILPIQRLGLAVASRRGLAVDGFRYQQDDTKVG
jgi:glucosamine--fructose-6-phosphate aminotransferase (isomerizing)